MRTETKLTFLASPYILPPVVPATCVRWPRQSSPCREAAGEGQAGRGSLVGRAPHAEVLLDETEKAYPAEAVVVGHRSRHRARVHESQEPGSSVVALNAELILDTSPHTPEGRPPAWGTALGGRSAEGLRSHLDVSFHPLHGESTPPCRFRSSPRTGRIGWPTSKCNSRCRCVDRPGHRLLRRCPRNLPGRSDPARRNLRALAWQGRRPGRGRRSRQGSGVRSEGLSGRAWCDARGDRVSCSFSYRLV
jgi:hypothetical protein